MDNTITGLILAGGQARRMGGGDKGLLTLGGKPLAQHAAERLQPQVGRLLINANRHHAAYAALADAVIPDQLGGAGGAGDAGGANNYAGPLAGIHAGMCAAESDWILSAPCDSPFFPLTLAEALMRAAQAAQAEVAVARAGGRAQPVFMLAKSALAADIAATLAEVGGKIDRWYARLAHVEVPFAEAAAFDNINTPAELQHAEARMSAARDISAA